MKKFYKLFSLLLVGIMCFATSTSTFASEKTTLSEVAGLKKDMAIIQEIENNDVQKFYNDKKDWVENVNNRLEAYLEGMTTEQKSVAIAELLGSNSVSTRSSLTTYFTLASYTWRDGYHTYNIIPKENTRLLKSVAESGWDALASVYSGIANDNGSLHDQYLCHWYGYFEYEWNIEEGRPNVGFAATVLAGCNP